MLDKFVHSINIVGTLYLTKRNIDFKTFILQLSHLVIIRTIFSLKNLVQISVGTQICQYMIFIKHNYLKSDIFLIPYLFHVFQHPCFSGSMFFWVQVFQGSGFSGFGSRVQVQGLGPGFRSSLQCILNYCKYCCLNFRMIIIITIQKI